MGMPPTEQQLASGTIVSPWPPISIAETSSTLTPSSIARNVRKRAVSSTPACPNTRCGGKPVTCQARCTMASSGLLTTMTTASGLVVRTSVATAVTILALVFKRSSRLMPGLRGMPAVITTTSLPAVSA